MDPLLAAAIAFSLSQVLLGLLLLLRTPALDLRAKLFAALLLANTCYLLAPVWGDSLAGRWLAPLQAAIPGVFWLFSSSVFDDRFSLRPWQVLLVAATVLMPMLGNGLGVVGTPAWLLVGLPQLVEFLLLALALWVVSHHWRTDLVEARRRLRLWFVGLSGVYILLLIFSREFLFAGQDWFLLWQYLSLALTWLVINTVLMSYRPGVVFGVPDTTVIDESLEQTSASPRESGGTSEVGKAAALIEDELVGRVRAVMEQEAPWREMGLTINQLADQLEVPQYRLRRAINAGLGYRNFSDFLNHYRIRETAERLQDGESDRLPVLTIAMDAGFRSLSSFNKAFKQAHGVTPTEFRKSAKN